MTGPALSLLLATALAAAPVISSPQEGAPSADEANRRLGRGINLGNALEAPSEGEWGMTLESGFFEAIAGAGFDSVRIPIRWSAHAREDAPYTIDAEFFDRVDWAVDQALSRGLNAVINVHHYEGLDRDPGAHRDRFLALWRQIGERYRDRPDSLYFELHNEPHDALDAESWNDLLAEALAVVRQTNPGRLVIIGPVRWNHIDALSELRLPPDDRRIIATVHCYEPFRFTHQGASWVDGSDAWLGTTWTGTPEEREFLTDLLDRAAEWGRTQDRPIYLGEFGAFGAADQPSRVRWTAFLRSEAERRGFSWAYWEFGSGFGAFDRGAGRWRPDLLGALVPGRGGR